MMDNEEKNLNEEFTEAVKDELNSNEETKKENTILDSKQETNNEELDTNVDEVINNAFNKEENNTEDVVTSNIEDNDNNNKNKKGNPLLLIFIILGLIILGVCTYYVYDNVINKDKGKTSDNNKTTTTTTTKVIVDEEDKSDKVLYIYYADVFDEKTDKSGDAYNLLDTYNCKNDNCSGYTLDGVRTGIMNNAIIIDGENIFLYDIETKSNVLSLNNVINTNKKVKNLIYFENELKGLEITDETGKSACYDLDLKKYVTDFKYEGYDGFKYFTKDLLIAFNSKQPHRDDVGLLIDSNGNFVYGNIIYDDSIDVINVNTGEVLYHKEIENLEMYDRIGLSKISDANNKYNYYLESEDGHYEILDLNFNLVLELNIIVAKGFLANHDVPKPQILTNGTIFMNYGNRFAIYDLNGNAIYKSKEYEQFIEVTDYDGYFAVVENNKIKIIDRSEKTIVEFDDWYDQTKIVSAFNLNNINECWKLNTFIIDGHWEIQSVSWCGEIDTEIDNKCGIKDNGIYIIAFDENSINGHIYYYNLTTKQVNTFIPETLCTEWR